MKKITIILLITITVIALKAQEQTLTQMFDSVFQHVNRTDATTGILYERVLPFSALHKFTGNTPDTANYDRFMQAYFEMYHAAFDIAQRLPFDIKITFAQLFNNHLN